MYDEGIAQDPDLYLCNGGSISSRVQYADTEEPSTSAGVWETLTIITYPLIRVSRNKAERDVAYKGPSALL